MALGRMTRSISIYEPSRTLDSEGFPTTTETLIATVRCEREGRHGSTQWRNRAAFTDATDLFRFRAISGTTVKTDMIINDSGEKFQILSVEDVKGRGMYIEVLAKVVIKSGD